MRPGFELTVESGSWRSVYIASVPNRRRRSRRGVESVDGDPERVVGVRDPLRAVV